MTTAASRTSSRRSVLRRSIAGIVRDRLPGEDAPPASATPGDPRRLVPDPGQQIGPRPGVEHGPRLDPGPPRLAHRPLEMVELLDPVGVRVEGQQAAGGDGT